MATRVGQTQVLLRTKVCHSVSAIFGSKLASAAVRILAMAALSFFASGCGALLAEFGFLRGTIKREVAVEDVFDASLAGRGSFGGGNGIGDVADEIDLLDFRFVGDGEIAFAAEFGEDFDEIAVLLFHFLDGATALAGIGNRQRVFGAGFGVGEEGTGGDDARADQFSGFDLAAPAA